MVVISILSSIMRRQDYRASTQDLSNKELYKIVIGEVKRRKNLQDTLAKVCLFDKKRTLSLMDIISDSVQPGMKGVDLGAGTGILGFAFLRAGGSYLYAVEHIRDLADLIEDVAAKLDFSSQIKVVREDATTSKFDMNFDFVMSEMVDTGLSQEPIVSAIINIRKYVNPGVIYVPQAALSSITILHGRKQLSAPVVYDNVSMANVSTCVNAMVEIPILKDGIADSARIDTKLIHPNGQETGRFRTLCYAVDVPLYFCVSEGDQKQTLFSKNRITRPIYEGQKILVHINYQYGRSMIGCFTLIN